MADTVVPPSPADAFDNSSMWYNFTAWTAQHLGYAVNMTRLAPSLEDLVWAGPRIVMKLGRLGSFISFPDAIDGFGQRIIPEATDANMFGATLTTISGTVVASTAPGATQSAVLDQDPSAVVSRFSLEGAKGLGSVFSYATSKWALCCIAMAVILNRTHIFAATRRRLRLRWPIRLLLRFVPIVLFVLQARSLLQSIQCQTSPDFAELRWGNASKSSDLMFSQRNNFLHGLSSTLNFGASDEESCLAVRMIPPDSQELPELRGSLSILWPLFGTFCLSQFIETVSCAVQGRPAAAETGMTLFEHSLAFAEADAAISNQLGWGMFTSSSANTTIGLTTASGSSIAVTRTMIMQRVNTPPEVLLVAFLSAMSHITSHLLGIFNLQSKFRLFSTGFWGLCFMASILWSVINFSLEDTSSQGLLRYPTVCLIGFIPHVLVLGGIMGCGFIYGLALTLSALAPPDTPGEHQQLTFGERLRRAHGNMQANVSLSDIRIRIDMDFYTALLRAGFGAITMASEAVYLNEDRRVNLMQHTWLEGDRSREIEELRMQWIGSGIPGSLFDSAGTIGLVPIKEGQAGASSGYAREKVAQKVSKNRGGERRIRDGVGAAERSGRWIMAAEYLMHIARLGITAWAIVISKVLTKLGLQNPPRWLRWLAQRPKLETVEKQRSARRERSAAQEWMAIGEGGMHVPRSDHVDVEADLRWRLQSGQPSQMSAGEDEVDKHLYGWWLKGGWWGHIDTSGAYEPSMHDGDDRDFDATSVISTTETSTSEADWESAPEDDGLDDLDDGQRTPTQRTTFATREPTPAPLVDSPMALSDLAKLLHPTTPEEREQAQALAAHLSSDRIMTRSGYRRQQRQQRAQVLATSRNGVFTGLADFARSGPSAGRMTPAEEEHVLEQILLRRRGEHGRRSFDSIAEVWAAVAAAEERAASSSSSWATGAPGLGPDGPQCVVCQSAPRTVIVWPCRCLSLCDDCRVSLAMNNFDKCVCCRREVISFSRIYVP